MRLEGPGNGLLLKLAFDDIFAADVFAKPNAGAGGGCKFGELGLDFSLYRGEEVDPGFDKIWLIADSLQVLPILANEPEGREGDEDKALPKSRLLLKRLSASVKSFNKPFARSLTSSDGSSSTKRLTVETRLGCLMILEGVEEASNNVLTSLSRFKRTTAFG
jgi:hypothetical protein